MLGNDGYGLLGGDPYGETKGPTLLDNDRYGYSSGGPKLGEDNYVSTGGKLGSDEGPGQWDFRTLPNKMLELVKNTGDMHQEGTGYYTDSESEMITILSYLNYGEKTGITESMIEQIEDAIKHLEDTKLRERDEVEKNSFIGFNLKI